MVKPFVVPAAHAVAWSLAASLGTPLAVFAAGVAPEVQPTKRVYDLPAQPLKQALVRFDAQTKVSVFYPSELVEGRTSHALQGEYSLRDALARLLEGTGLDVQATAADAFVLTPSDDARERAGTGEANRLPFDRLVQTGMREALCGRPSLALGTYRLAMAVRFDADGHVRQVRLLDTTGDRVRDVAIIETVGRVVLPGSPANPVKPYVVLVKPVECRAEAVCQMPCDEGAGRQ